VFGQATLPRPGLEIARIGEKEFRDIKGGLQMKHISHSESKVCRIGSKSVHDKAPEILLGVRI